MMKTTAESFGYAEVSDKQYCAMQQSLKRSTAVVLTEEDYQNLFIHRDKSPSPIPAPTMVPTINILERAAGMVKIQISDQSTPDINHRRLPNGVFSINVFVAIIAPDAPPPPEDDFRLFVTEDKATISLQFAKAEARNVAYIEAQFANKNGVSRRSVAVSTVIPS